MCCICLDCCFMVCKKEGKIDVKDGGAFSRGIRKKEESLDQSSNPRCSDEREKSENNEANWKSEKK